MILSVKIVGDNGTRMVIETCIETGLSQFLRSQYDIIHLLENDATA
jgi:hypothetical protein